VNSPSPAGSWATARSPRFVRHSAVYVDRILKGAKPADIPVEQPTNVELVVNLRAAKAMGISVPQRMMVRAGRVIE
jgi:putative ABC transport system substrate-binding protein